MLLPAALVIACAAAPLRLHDVSVGGTRVSYVEAKLSEFELGVTVAVGFPYGDEDFASMVSRVRPGAAINGAYFDVKTKKPIGDIVIGGQVRLQGRMGTALSIGKDGTVDIGRVKFHRTMDWSKHETVLACGPALVLDGRIDVRPRDEGFSEEKIFQKHARMGVGIDGARVLFINVTTPVTFEEFAQVCLRLGCREAMNLDAGASTAMWLNGALIRKPGRRLTNILTLTPISHRR